MSSSPLARRIATAGCVLAFLATPVLANTFTVNSNTDTGSGAATSGDFRYCINQANADATTPRVINFAIPGGGVQTITLTSALPTVTKFTTIDATTQPGYAGTPLVVLNGNSGDFDGLTINAFFTGNVNNKTFVKGLCIINCGTNGGGVPAVRPAITQSWLYSPAAFRSPAARKLR